MESWVSTLIKDIKGKVGFSGNQLISTDSEQNDSKFTEISCDFFPSGLSASEHRLLAQYLMKVKQINASHNVVNIFGRLLFMEDLALESAESEPCLELDMSKTGHACIAVPTEERSWPPEEGYTFACWFKYRNLKSQQTGVNLKLFSVSSTDEENAYNEELYLKDDGVLTLDINGSYSLSSDSLELEEGQWYHLAVVLGPRNTLVAEHPSGTVYIYIDGNLRHTGELRYTPLVDVVKHLLITVGMPVKYAEVSDLKWALRSFYLFREQLSPDCIRFMYVISRGYKVLFQGENVLHRSNNEAEDEYRSRIPDSRSDFRTETSSTTDVMVIPDSNGANTDYNMEMQENLWLELCGKKLIYAFNATRTEALPASQSLKLLNLVDPVIFPLSPNGMPQSGHLCGDISVCRRCVTGNIIHQITGIAVVLALIESAETTDMLYTALRLLASVLHQNLQSAKQMKACRGYELLSSFLRNRINLFDVQCLHVLFKISVHEDSFISEVQYNMSSPELKSQVTSSEFETEKILDELYVAEYHEKLDDSLANEEAFSHRSEPVHSNTAVAISLSGALSDGDLVEHVLLDWTIWVTSPLSIQMEILNFVETLVSVYKYKDHNLIILHERNIVQHLLIALHMDDIEVPVIQKFVVLLTVILEGKFLESELNSVTKFMLTTFDPPEVTQPLHATREMKSKGVILRNIMLEALIDLQVTISAEELLDQWHSIVSSKLITYFLDEAVHPTTMGWIITLLGMCLTSSSTFALKFQKNEGYESLNRVLPNFSHSLDIYYTLFCLVFSKPIYPKLPEVGILDFEALMASNGESTGLKFGNLLDSVVTMIRSVFDQLRLQPLRADHNASVSEASAEEFAEGNSDIIEEVTGEALLYNTHAASLLGWDSAANVTSMLRFTANLAKMWPSFASICARAEFLESCVDLYFSIVRTYLALKGTSEHNFAEVVESPILESEGHDFWFTEVSSQRPSDENTHSQTSSSLLLEIDDSGYVSDPGSAGATAVLDLIAEVLSYSLIEQTNSFPALKSILDSVPLNFDFETVLTFKSLCLLRMMNYLERRLLNNGQRGGHMSDKNNLWSNMGSFCNLVVDCVYIGVFPKPSSVMRVLEFCLSMLHSAKNDGQIDEASQPWTGLLSIWRGSQPIDPILKSTNRMILYCFLPSFLVTVGEGALISSSGFVHEPRTLERLTSSGEETRFDICIVLELLHAHKEIVFHSGNLDVDVYSSLCIHLTALFTDQRKDAQNAAFGIMTHLLTHCRAALEGIFTQKSSQEEQFDVLNGGFDKLLTESVSVFMEWFQTAEHDIKRLLHQFACIRWSKYIEESAKFSVETLASLEDHRTSRLGKKVEDASKLESECRDQYAKRRSGHEAKRIAACSELEHARQKKYESAIDVADEWKAYLQQLSHEHKLESVSTMAWEDYWPLF
ncbi:hypothetical protein vseg_003221 [Gypsophila vaccaria]